MATLASSTEVPLRRRARGQRLVGNLTLAMVLFVMVEVMLFLGLISAFLIVKATVNPALWPPAGQPRLPIWSTAINTVALLASGQLLRLAWRRFQASPPTAAGAMTAAMGLGAFFLVFQGAEWLRLLAQGLTLRSSHLGSFFYLIIGAHALHAMAALGLLILARRRLRQERLSEDLFGAAAVFWGFVVLMWPALYGIVYLG